MEQLNRRSILSFAAVFCVLIAGQSLASAQTMDLNFSDSIIHSNLGGFGPGTDEQSFIIGNVTNQLERPVIDLLMVASESYATRNPEMNDVNENYFAVITANGGISFDLTLELLEAGTNTAADIGSWFITFVNLEPGASITVSGFKNYYLSKDTMIQVDEFSNGATFEKPVSLPVPLTDPFNAFELTDEEKSFSVGLEFEGSEPVVITLAGSDLLTDRRFFLAGWTNLVASPKPPSQGTTSMGGTTVVAETSAVAATTVVSETSAHTTTAEVATTAGKATHVSASTTMPAMPASSTAPGTSSMMPASSTAPGTSSMMTASTTLLGSSTMMAASSTGPGTSSMMPASSTAPGSSSMMPASSTAPGSSSMMPASSTAPGSSSMMPASSTAPGSSSMMPASSTAPGTSSMMPASTTLPGTSTMMPVSSTKPGTSTVMATTEVVSTTPLSTTAPGSTTLPASTTVAGSTTAVASSTLMSTTPMMSTPLSGSHEGHEGSMMSYTFTLPPADCGHECCGEGCHITIKISCADVDPPRSLLRRGSGQQLATDCDPNLPSARATGALPAATGSSKDKILEPKAPPTEELLLRIFMRTCIAA
eukprot:CAMPEP_0170591530 /NCGR_PEP_ID=MMETSP0224-20130122/12452_1 /TAXON_ID=285029 /ORGANISM="Togula jolla, Strain CCCM 725" /LENGTH=592 /DNA_ID=CAMNT_0010915399 /DNA_START=121 /DNA_END=1897 /DNA_ORIENTATION=+